MGADEIDADRARKTQVKGAGGFIFAPYLAAMLLDCFLKLKRISMNRNFKIPDGMTAGEVAHRIAGEKKDHLGVAGNIPQRAQSSLLIGGEPVLKKVNVVGHQSLLPRSPVRSKSLRWLRLQGSTAEVANQYVNTNTPGWLE